ncbi:MAG: glycogen debranching enzyme, partial [Mycolicibacterium hassiacum]
ETGDEIGRTQGGNNNAYCQDNPVAWVDWSLVRRNADLLAFTRKLTGFRRDHPVFRRRRFFDGKPIRSGAELRDIAWLTPSGTEMTPQDWDSGLDQCVAVFLNGDAIPEPDARGERVVDDTFLLCFNAHAEAVDFVLPGPGYAADWEGALDTAHPLGESDLRAKAGETITLPGRSLLVLRKTG